MKHHLYLGTHEPSWLRTAGVPLFVSHRRLSRLRTTLPQAAAPWALDSGGFSELSMFGGWRTTPEAYVAAVVRYDEQIGRLDWAAPQDWMCEPDMIAKTGLSVVEHQERTVRNYVRLRELWADASEAECPFMPVLQGYATEDYLRCMDMYGEAGVDLGAIELVGVGSVCRRQHPERFAACSRRSSLPTPACRCTGSASSRWACASTGTCWRRPTRWRGHSMHARTRRCPVARTGRARRA
ncbi:queuine tRNA-ribosyltransferase [Mycobacterium phage Geraldini]|nr:queuine tRNA-ribosyltransferase [Mycobacterium phage Geraldini]